MMFPRVITLFAGLSRRVDAK